MNIKQEIERWNELDKWRTPGKWTVSLVARLFRIEVVGTKMTEMPLVTEPDSMISYRDIDDGGDHGGAQQPVDLLLMADAPDMMRVIREQQRLLGLAIDTLKDIYEGDAGYTESHHMFEDVSEALTKLKQAMEGV